MPTTALHQKYRPKILAELVGQPYVQTALTNAINRMHIAPAYLFTGSRGTGKTSTARIFAKSLNCLSFDGPTDEPCGTCQSCRSIETSNSLDVSEIDAASNNGVDDARALIERSSLAPVQGRSRIFILDEAHQLTTQSQNALLKCIEEPPPHVVFILCTTEVHKVLPTIVSRCQVFHFRALSLHTISQHLQDVAEAEAIAVSDDALMAIARFAEGGLRDALQLLGQVSLLGEKVTANHVIEITGGVTETDLLAILDAIATNDIFQLLKLARTLVDSGKTPKLILSSLLQTYRDLLILKSAPKASDLLTSPANYNQLKVIASHWDFDVLNQSLMQLQKAEGYLRNTTNAAVWLETCLLNLMPLLRSGSPNQPNGKQPAGKNGHHRKAAIEPSSAATEDSSDLSAVWQRVIVSAKPGTQKLLSQGRLIKLQGNKAILEVAPASLAKFETNQQAIARMLQRVIQSQKPMTVLIRTLAASRNGRSG
ncbi:DNA polymerase III subunit gamma/tau [Leptolyngbya sp. AN02str]|jgi:DNA polymerase-3 subunit gamma/tau|uniref:DNA polymerase III subunit gamma/tau n=1 Tax=Leptolyngbya sp. NK1-12 TaxID=2547451 RepID=A0AA96WRJ1_9CYAN|nr:DNA polymerase III subunit gamma/tau [Leptolyngbya sp. NK1-12]WNZ28076.1 DNA polymerase III subunit gamma/tau [Leptolyngbya sp. NK1-12]